MPSITAAESESEEALGDCVCYCPWERSWITNVWADGFSLRSDSPDTLVRNNGGESPLAAGLPLRCTEAGGRMLRAGRASMSPGRVTSAIDHSCLSGPWLPLRLQTVSQPSSSICLPCGDPSALHSSAHGLEASKIKGTRCRFSFVVAGSEYSPRTAQL